MATRRFTPHELMSMTSAQVQSLSDEDRREWQRQLLALWRTQDNYLDGDYEFVDSRRRYEWGE